MAVIGNPEAQCAPSIIDPRMKTLKNGFIVEKIPLRIKKIFAAIISR
jgi:hypothetical protein